MKDALEHIIAIVNKVEKKGHALNELAVVRCIAQQGLTIDAHRPYTFTNAQGVLIEMAPFIGEPFSDFSGHCNPIGKEEMAIICARKARESDLIVALRAMWEAGEREAALRRVKEIFGPL